MSWLTSIEQLYYFDSTPRFPNRITCRLVFAKTIDDCKAQEACFWLSHRHSVLNWRIGLRRNRPFWDSTKGRFQKSDVNREGGTRLRPDFDNETSPKWFHLQDLEGPPTENPRILDILGPDHFFEPCLIVRRWEESTGSRFSDVWFTVPHSFCDGAGGVLVANDWIQIYNNLEKGVAPLEGLTRLDRARLIARNRLGLNKWKFLRLLPFQAIGLFGACKFVFRKSARFEEKSPSQSGTTIESQAFREMASASVGCWLEQSSLANLEKLVERLGYNLNARFLGGVFHTLHQFRSENGSQTDSKDWLRVILPINLREIEDRRMEAANKSSLVQIDRRGGADPGDPGFYKSIQNEIGVIHKYKLDRMFLVMIRIIARIPVLLRRIAASKKHRGMAIFTNLGHPFKRVEKLALRDSLAIPIEVDFLAPLRHGTPLNFAVCRYCERLRITIHYDPYVLDESQAAEILETYKENICYQIEGDDLRTCSS